MEHATKLQEHATSVLCARWGMTTLLDHDNIVAVKKLQIMKTDCTTWIFILACLLPLGIAAQDNLKIKDPDGNVLLEAREDGVVVRKMTTAVRTAVAGLGADDNGLMVYDTDTKSLWVWKDTEWVEIDGIDLVEDADADPTNELQDWVTLPGIPAGFLDGIDNVDDGDNDPTNELQSWNNLPDIPAGFLDGVDNVDDEDNDPTNELQDWSNLPGVPVDFADGVDNVDDADNDPTNELQDWSNLPGVPVDFTDGVDNVDDADNDPTNELQDWSNLPGVPADFADGVDNVNDADADPTNELQEWNNLPGIPTDFADGVDNVNDADADPTNEINTSLLLSGEVLELTDFGGILSVNLSSLVDDGDWIKDEGKVYNTGENVGVGTDAPATGLHVRGSKGLGEHVMLIENQNHEGSGLKIKIDGSHPLWVTGEGGNPDFFITHPGSAILGTFEPLADDIRTYLLGNNAFDLSDISFSTITSPGGLLDQLGLVDLMSGGICKGAGTLVGLVNDIGLQSITLPTLTELEENLMDIPLMPLITPLPSTLSINPPSFCFNICCGIGEVCLNPPSFNAPIGVISNPINTFNTGLSGVNTGIGLVNTAFENAHDDVRGAIDALSGIEIPLPQLQVPTQIGGITCPNPNPLDAFTFSFESLNPLDYNIVNPLTTENAFITFSDQFDNKLGAITAQGLGEFTQDYFEMEKVLEIGGHITGLFSDDGNIVENLIELGKEAVAYYKATDKIGVLYSSGHGDYAEWLERENHSEVIGYGDIVGIRGGKISLSIDGAEQIMVVSKAPIVLGNIPAPGKERTGNNIAFIGQVPAKVMGPVSTGDYIVANPDTPGYGIAIPASEITPDQLARAVGRSWETHTTAGFKFVNAIVGMHNNGWAVPVTKLQQRLDTQEMAIQMLTERLDNLEYGSGLASTKKPRR